jgi:ubiquinone/menaquinone biosynthesis C-methylase UbiE
MENPNVTRFMGFADVYEKYRPTPPAIIADLLLQLAGMDRADHVVDLGCGTGLSALMWLNRTGSFTGVEPSSDMRAVASQRPEWLSTTTHAEFVAGEAHQTLKEVARVLRSGGVFAAYDCDWPPVSDPVADAAFAEWSPLCR